MTLAIDCPICGAQNTLDKIPKYRNNIQGRLCRVCQRTFFREIKTYDHGASSSKGNVDEWESIEGNRMGVKDFEGI